VNKSSLDIFNMHHPYQAISIAFPGESPGISFLVAASGSKLLSINLSDGTIAALWQAELFEANVRKDFA
jgi:hypothetical protein